MDAIVPVNSAPDLPHIDDQVITPSNARKEASGTRCLPGGEAIEFRTYIGHTT
jgi:hypothetical protein